MSERWQQELERLHRVDPTPGLLERAHKGPRDGGPTDQRTASRIATVTVSLALVGLSLFALSRAFETPTQDGKKAGQATPGAPSEWAAEAPDWDPKVITQIDLGNGLNVSAIETTPGGIWVHASGMPEGSGSDGSGLIKIDPATNEIVRVVPVLVSPNWEIGGGGLAYDGESLWVTGGGGTLQRVDPASGRVTATLGLEHKGNGADVSVSSDGVFVATMGAGQSPAEVIRVDAATMTITGRVQLQESYVRRVVAVNGKLIVSEYRWDNGGPVAIYTAIDPETLQVTGRFDTGEQPDASPQILAAGDTIYGIVDDGLVALDPVTAEPQGDPMSFDGLRGAPRGFLISDPWGFWYGAYPGGGSGSSDRLTFMDGDSGSVTAFDDSVQLTGDGVAAAIQDNSLWELTYDGNVTRIDLTQPPSGNKPARPDLVAAPKPPTPVVAAEPGEDTYVFTNIKVEYPYVAREDAAPDPGSARITFESDWSGSVYPGEADCEVRLQSADGTDVGGISTGWAHQPSHIDYPPSDQDYPGQIAAVSSVPVGTTWACSAGQKPADDVRVEDAEVVGQGDRTYLRGILISASGRENIGTQDCKATAQTVESFRTVTFQIDAPANAYLTLTSVNDVDEWTNAEINVTCKPFTGTDTSRKS